jgi:nicotinamidase/pyrazinamidase
VNGARGLVSSIQEQMNLTKNASWLIITTRDWHPEKTVHFDNWPAHCIANTSWAAYIDGIDSNMIDTEIFKWFRNSNDGYSGFEWVDALSGDEIEWFETLSSSRSLEQILRSSNVQVLKIVWLATDFCVFATARDAKNLGFDVTVLRSWIAAVNVPNLPTGEDKLRELAEMWVKISS